MKSYLIIKLSAIGDVIMAMPMIDAIRKKDKEAYIVWVCGMAVKPLLEQLPIDEIITVDEKKLFRGSKIEKIGEIIKLWNRIAFRSFDIVALGHADRRYHILTALTKAKVFHAFSHKEGTLWPIPGRHHTDEYIRLVDALQDKRCFASPIHLQFTLDKEITKQLNMEKKKIVLTPGGAKNILADDRCRRWPIKNYVTLAKLLITNGYQVILCGAKSDEWVVPYFTDLPVLNLVGKTNLKELVALFNHVDFIVTHDSGPMHLAGMSTSRMIALFGPTDPHEKIPRRQGVTYFWNREKYNCCPCYDGKNYALCDKVECMRDIEPGKVYSHIDEIMRDI